MKNVLIGICMMIMSVSFAQETTIQVNDKVNIKSEADIKFLLDAHYDKNKHCDLAKGYRIQIMNSSNREEVYAKKAEVYALFSEFKAYIVYDQPYYKLRLGDFKTKLEARKFLEEITTEFQTAFIVRDEIKIN